MKMTKKKALFAIFAVSVIALAGVGYAAVNYTAKASSTSGNITSAYVTVTATGPAFSSPSVIHALYNSYNDGSDIDYEFSSAEDIVINVTYDLSKAASNSDTYTMTIELPTLELPTGVTYEWIWSTSSTPLTISSSADPHPTASELAIVTGGNTLTLVLTGPAAGTYGIENAPGNIAVGAVNFTLVASHTHA